MYSPVGTRDGFKYTWPNPNPNTNTVILKLSNPNPNTNTVILKLSNTNSNTNTKQQIQIQISGIFFAGGGLTAEMENPFEPVFFFSFVAHTTACT